MDIGSWRCPVCGCLVEGEMVSDPTLVPRINEHRLRHLIKHAADCECAICIAGRRAQEKSPPPT